MGETMERIQQQTWATRLTGWLLLAAIACTGCGAPMYHFLHYHSPFEAVARSNKTYFHSQKTGRIIEKDACDTYCEPACHGYEPTCWSPWPAECPGNCPVAPQDTVQQVIIEGQPIQEPNAVPYQEPVPIYQGAPVVPDQHSARPSMSTGKLTTAPAREQLLPTAPTQLPTVKQQHMSTRLPPPETMAAPRLLTEQRSTSVIIQPVIPQSESPVAAPVSKTPATELSNTDMLGPDHWANNLGSTANNLTNTKPVASVRSSRRMQPKPNQRTARIPKSTSLDNRSLERDLASLKLGVDPQRMISSGPSLSDLVDTQAYENQAGSKVGRSDISKRKEDVRAAKAAKRQEAPKSPPHVEPTNTAVADNAADTTSNEIAATPTLVAKRPSKLPASGASDAAPEALVAKPATLADNKASAKAAANGATEEAKHVTPVTKAASQLAIRTDKQPVRAQAFAQRKSAHVSPKAGDSSRGWGRVWGTTEYEHIEDGLAAAANDKSRRVPMSIGSQPDDSKSKLEFSNSEKRDTVKIGSKTTEESTVQFR